MKLYGLEQWLAKFFFSERSDRKYFRLYGPVAIIQLSHTNANAATDDGRMKGCDCDPVKHYLQK